MSEAALEFVSRYTREDGSLVWRSEWPGMDGSDDAYESFHNLPLLAALGGDPDVDTAARRCWEGVTQQFTQYGQVWREFDAYYDWMHHGESSLLFYFFGLARPEDNRMAGRARRFAEMYTGDDPLARNYDHERRMVRSPINGSRGPRFVNTADDWLTHRPVLANYPPPFEDVPGIAPDAPTADWTDDALFARILELLNARMMRGDVPLNLAATSLVANAYLYTGDERYRDWVGEYIAAWVERAAANGDVLPDNIGPSGEIGELMGGKWWGGYYGWRWPHGFLNLIESALIAAANSLLLRHGTDALKLPRALLDRLHALGREEEGIWRTPHRHGDSGWYDFRPVDPSYAISLWSWTLQEEDARRVDAWSPPDAPGGPLRPSQRQDTNLRAWYDFVHGRRPTYPVEVLRSNCAEMLRRLERIRSDDGDPEEWDVHHWQELNPVVLEGLTQLTLGGPQPVYHGGLLQVPLRYRDPESGRPGLPADVAALVSRVDTDGVTLTLQNVNAIRERVVVVQAGAYGEHCVTHVTQNAKECAVEAPAFAVTIGPGCAGTVTIGLRRHCRLPSYRHRG
jgi:hypothetical protein